MFGKKRKVENPFGRGLTYVIVDMSDNGWAEVLLGEGNTSIDEMEAVLNAAAEAGYELHFHVIDTVRAGVVMGQKERHILTFRKAE